MVFLRLVSSASGERRTELKVSGGSMDGRLASVESMISRIEQLAESLHGDPDGHVRRSATELRSAFAARRAIEPAVARVRSSVLMLRCGNREGARREFLRRTPAVDHLEQVLERELLPTLRQLGFDV